MMRRSHSLLFVAIAAAVLGGSNSARGAVVSATDSGFEVLESVSVSASPKEAYARLLNVGGWWNKEHTFSGDAANLTLDARAGGCFCERLRDGGGVQHLTVVYVAPNQALRLTGGLGPLQALGVAGSMTITFTPSGDGTAIALRYRVGGYTSDGIRKWAVPVDEVLGEQLGRLKRYIDTGRPDADAPAQK